MLELQFEKIIKGRADHKSSNLGLNLLISRLKRKYETDQTPEEMKNCVKEMNLFFEKYKKIVTEDVEKIKKM